MLYRHIITLKREYSTMTKLSMKSLRFMPPNFIYSNLISLKTDLCIYISVLRKYVYLCIL